MVNGGTVLSPPLAAIAAFVAALIPSASLAATVVAAQPAAGPPASQRQAYQLGALQGLEAVPVFLRELAGVQPWPLTSDSELRQSPGFQGWNDHRKMSRRDLGRIFTLKRSLEHALRATEALKSKISIQDKKAPRPEAYADLMRFLGAMENHLRLLSGDWSFVLPEDFRRQMLVAAEDLERRIQERGAQRGQPRSWLRKALSLWRAAGPSAPRLAPGQEQEHYDDGLAAGVAVFLQIPRPDPKADQAPRRRRIWWGLPWNELWLELSALRGEPQRPDEVYFVEEDEDTFDAGRAKAAQQLKWAMKIAVPVATSQFVGRSPRRRDELRNLAEESGRYFTDCPGSLRP